jgi:hypothetical protein
MDQVNLIIYYLFVGSVKKGKEAKADVTFTILDDDLISMADGKLNP